MTEDYAPTIGGHPTVQQHIVRRATNEFLIWLDEKWVERDWP